MSNPTRPAPAPSRAAVTTLHALLAIALAMSCPRCGSSTDAAGAVTFQNTLFTRTSTLQAAADGTPATPSLSWPATGRRLVVAAFFRQHIDVRQNLITNQDDLVWMWHSGMDGGREGNVPWDGGSPARWGQPLVGEVPQPLAAGTYYWAVWALDDAGKPIQSTLELHHTVP